jgi:hypothetical protein
MAKPNYSFLSDKKSSTIGYNRSSIWQTKRESSYQSSNYWLKDSIFDRKQSFFNDYKSVETEKKFDYLQLAQYQRAISNFVRILTGRNDIAVKYHTTGESYTDGKTITLSANIQEKEFDTAVGLALHESSHILYTDFKTSRDFIDALDYREQYFVKTIFNVIEDLYIDAMTYKAAPGYRGYYAALYQKYFGSDKLVKGMWSLQYSVPNWDNYIYHIVNIRNPKRNLKALPKLEEIFKLIDLQNITRLDETHKRLNLSFDIFSTIRHYLENEKPSTTNNTSNGTDNSSETNDNDEKSQNDMDSEDTNESQNDMDSEDTNESQNDMDSEDTNETNQMENLSDSMVKTIYKLHEKQLEVTNGTLKKKSVTKNDNLLISGFASIDLDKKIVGQNSEFSSDNASGVPLYIVRNVNKIFMDSGAGLPYGVTRDSNGWGYTFAYNLISEGVKNGKILAKKLQVRNEERVTKSTRLDSGKLDNRLLHEIGFDNFDVFSKINISSYKPAYIHISVDQSGSMQGSKWEESLKFAAMMATVSKMLTNVHIQVSVRSTFSDSSNASRRNRFGASTQIPYLMYIFDSKKNSIRDILDIFPRLDCTGLTPEGLCFDGIMSEIISQSRNNDAYFINLCDGQPYMLYSARNSTTFLYNGSAAQKHSKQQMKKMQRNGIKFLTYFIQSGWSGGRDWTEVKECYGDNAVRISSSNEITSIAKSINTKLLSA